jgi:hypothetical protein
VDGELAVTAAGYATGPVVGIRLAGGIVFLALALGGCAAGNSSNGSTGGNPDGGMSDSGTSGGSSGSNTGGSNGSGGATASGGSHGSGGSSPGGAGGASNGSGGSSSGGAGRSGGSPCMITLTPLAPASLLTVEVGPTALLQIQGVVSHANLANPTWKWAVTSPTQTTVMIKKQDDKEGPPPSSVVTFPVTMVGRYQILAQTSDTSCAPPPALLITGTMSMPSFNLRVTAAGFPVQEKRITPSVSSSISWSLDQGGTYLIEPRQVGQITVMPAYLRITNAATTFGVEGYTSHGAVRANLISNFVYDLLVIPNDPTFAPNLFRSVTPDVWTQPITFDQGVRVNGLILGPDGAPLSNARMVLKLDGRPSTVGISDASGALALWTRPGNMSAIVVPPDGSGLPQANVTASPESSVSLGSTESSLSLKMEYQTIPTAALAVMVRDVDGTAPVAGARVRLTSNKDVPNVGVLTSKSSAGPDITISASGSINQEMVSDANGTASFGNLPMSPYDIVVVPPSGSAGAITSVALPTLPVGGTSTVKLGRKVSLTGTLVSPGGAASVAGASITAVDKTGDVAGAVVAATADAAGAFKLQVDPNRTYQLLIQPLAGQALGRMVVGNVDVKDVDTSLTNTIMLPPGVTFTGTVSGGNSNVGGAFLQVFCVPSATWCPDGTVSLAEGMTKPDGSFSFILPNPAP